MAKLDLINLTKQFAGVTAVNQLNLHVADGEFVCLLGPSGCGKSTALRMIAGFEPPTSGDVRIDDVSVVSQPANKRPTAMVFQKYTLWPHMKVFENIAFGLQLRHMPKPEIERKVTEVLELVGLAGYGPRYPRQLSGGQQQRIALARAIVLEPKILLLDEPFSSLDALLRVRLREELRRIQRKLHITAVFVTHDQEEALSLADRIAVISAGKIEQVDKPSTIYSNPQTLFVADFIGAMNLLPGKIDDGALRLGDKTLAVPADLARGDVMVALRPEDLLIAPEAQANGVAWPARIDQVMDLGHYRKVLVDVPGLGELKVFLSKSVSVGEGETVSLIPSRYLIYSGGSTPVEVNQPLNQDTIAVG